MNIIALDVGGTAIKYAYFEGDTLVFQKSCPSESRLGGPKLVDKMQSVIQSILADYPADKIGISCTGQIDSLHGSVLFSNDNIPHFTGMKIKEILENRFHLPVFVENDVNAAAIGEAVYGAGAGQKDFLMLTYGTGIGGAIFINHHLFTGSNQVAAEFGHMLIHPGGIRCGCGAHGCYEMYGSTTALVKKASAVRPEFNNGKALFNAFNQNDAEAKQLIDDWITEISYGLINLTYIFNPSCILLGGGIMAQPYIQEQLNKIVHDNLVESFQGVVLRNAALGNLAGVYGMKAVCNGAYPAK